MRCMERKLAGLTALLLLLQGSPAGAGVIAPGLARTLDKLADGEPTSALVHLADQADIRALDAQLRKEGASRAKRHERVVTALRDAAKRSQPALVAALESGRASGKVSGYTPHWITNVVVVTATKSELVALAARSDVAVIEPNFAAAPLPAKPAPGTLEATQSGGIERSLKAIGADRVWSEFGITGAGRLVANLDTGVRFTHPALRNRWRGNHRPWQECWRDPTPAGTHAPTDYVGHGTMVMGVLCGSDGATGDTVGVAPDAEWIADRSLDADLGHSFDNYVLGAYEWLADPDGDPATVTDVPDVVQNSWGVTADLGFGYRDCDERWQQAIENCEAAGVVQIFSAGNAGPDPQSLGSPANIARRQGTNFAVGAVDGENHDFPYPVWDHSSRGPSDCDPSVIKPELTAPGVDVRSTSIDYVYERWSATSLAGPFVAGTVALMRQANPDADVELIKQILLKTAIDEGLPGADNDYGRGVLDAYTAVRAVMAADLEAPAVTVIAPNAAEYLPVGTPFTIRWSATDNMVIARTELALSLDAGATYTPLATLPFDPGTYDWVVPDTPSNTARIRVTCIDARGNAGADVSDRVFSIGSAGAYLWSHAIDVEIRTQSRTAVATATVHVRDQNGNPAEGATVRGVWSGPTQDHDQFVTDASGTGTCLSDAVRAQSGCFRFTVENVLKPGYTFQSALGEISDQACIRSGKAASEPAGPLAIRQVGAGRAAARLEFEMDVAESGPVEVSLYSVAGRRVATLVNRVLPAGKQTLAWDGVDERGARVPSGLYFVRATSGSQQASRKVTILR